MRAQYCLDAARAGDALLAVTSAYRINYETWGNLDPALHTHIVPGYRDEPEPQRFQPVCVGYDQARAPIRSTDRRAVHGGDAEGVVRHDLGPGAAPAREFGQWLVEKRIDAL
jgi:diadenosine tetraphosphate (Ap4A) HIT family hydrolase